MNIESSIPMSFKLEETSLKKPDSPKEESMPQQQEVVASKSHEVGTEIVNLSPSKSDASKKSLSSSGLERLKQGEAPSPNMVIKKELERIKEDQGLDKCQIVRNDLLISRKRRMPKVGAFSPEELYKKFEMSPPIVFSHLEDQEKIVVLWRGCRADKLVKMVENHSAGGVPFNKDAEAPTEAQAKDQVGELASFPEFTADPRIAQQFSKGIVVAAFAIPKRYLAKGSRSESGFICKADAPVRLIAWEEGPALSSATKSTKEVVSIKSTKSLASVQAKTISTTTLPSLKIA